MKTAWISCLLALLTTLPLRAEQMKELGPWQVHYSAFNSSFLTPDVAKAYGLERSRYNGIINIAVQNKQGVAQAVGITGEAKNLTGTLRTLTFQEVKEGDAIYYLAVLPYRNQDTYQFTLKIMGGGAATDAHLPADLLRRLRQVSRSINEKAPNSGSGLFHLADSAGGREVVDLPRSRVEAWILILMMRRPLHGLTEALLLGKFVAHLIDGPLGLASLHLAGIAIAELLVLGQHPVRERLTAL
ncbi:hypothetical protein K931_16304 [Aeromonas salmonicida subsp. pectinolytica 34mel]|nr:hypothetical protein K931_16304 [Aeromonas salmonicida subsp. pectinolytica 34mel]